MEAITKLEARIEAMEKKMNSVAEILELIAIRLEAIDKRTPKDRVDTLRDLAGE